MKVSNPLNDLAANLGVTIKVLIQLAMGPDKEFREMVRMLLSALPEEEAVIIAEDREIDAQFLDYLSRVFETRPLVLHTLLKNPSTPSNTVERIAKLLPSADLETLAKDPAIRPELLEQLFKIFGNTQVALLKLIAEHPATPPPLRGQIAPLLSKEPETEDSTATPPEKKLKSDSRVEDALKEALEAGPRSEFPSEVALSSCVHQLFEVNFNIIADFMKRINQQVLKQLERLAEANRQILQVIAKNAGSLNLGTLQLSADLVAFVTRKLPDSVSEQEILEFLKRQQASRQGGEGARKEGEESPQERAEGQETADEGEKEEEEEDYVSLQEQIKKMTVGERLRLARMGGMSARRLLIRDINKEVAKSVLENPKITETEIEAIASMREAYDEVLRAIGTRKEWIGNYNIMLRLIKNPKTPTDLSLSYLSRVSKKDLDFIQKSKSVPEVVRNYARAILLQRMQSKK